MCSFVLPAYKRTARKVPGWRAWVPEKPLTHACPVCLRANDRPVHLLIWRMTLMLTCPHHHCRLELRLLSPDFRLNRLALSTVTQPRNAPPHMLALDAKTWMALNTGKVQLSCQRIHARLWFRLLRGLVEELSGARIVSPVDAVEAFEEIWERAGVPPRGGMRQ